MPFEQHEADKPRPDAPLAGDILRGVLDPLLTLDSALKVNTANPAFYETYDLTQEQVLGQDIFQIGDGLWDIPRLRDLLEAVRDRNETFRDYEIAHTFETLGRRVMLLNAVKIQASSEGHDELILLAMKDVTAQKEAEEALRRSEQQLRMIVENAQEFAIITMDLEGHVTTWNSGAERLLGYKRSEIIGRDGRVIFTREDRDQGEADRELNTALTEGRAENERWHVRKDGSRFWGSGLVMALRDDHREIRGLMKIMRDMTAQYRLWQAREARARELEQRVAEATAEARQRASQLETLTRHLHQAEQRERRRLAHLLHDDLQQMLAAVKMRLHLAEGDANPRALLQECQSLMDQAIGTSRSLSHELNPSVLRDRGFVPALHWLAQNVEARHQLPVQVDADEHAADHVPDDIRDALFHMVRELLFNVVKHANASQAWVAVAAIDSGGVRLIVDDDGVGCPPDSTANNDDESGHGLQGIRERLMIWHGQLKRDQGPQGGCRVLLEIPRLPAN